jgi:glycosyltransferase involved in cell wall biosynthesis
MTAVYSETSVPAVEPLRCSAVLTHHWLVRVRGGEKVLEALAELLPDAPIYTLVHDPAGVADSPLARRTVHTSSLQHLPGATRHYPKLLPLLPWAAHRMKLPPVDLVVCSDAALAKAMTPDPRSRVVCYCHSPMRYAFDAQISREYCLTLPLATRPFWGLTTALVRRADWQAAQRVDQFVANSRHVAARIKQHYQRDAVVVHPPVDIPPAPATGPREDFYLCVGYHVPYKRLDLAIDACRQLRRKLVVIGEGPEVSRLKPRTDDSVQWLGWQQPVAINDYYCRAAALLFPGEEDFGIVPVEAMAHGCPVIAYAVGGATETVLDGQTGVWFDRQTPDCLAEAMRRCEQARFDTVMMHRHAQQFSKSRFLQEMSTVLRAAAGRSAR